MRLFVDLLAGVVTRRPRAYVCACVVGTVYLVKPEGWIKVRATDVNDLHYRFAEERAKEIAAGAGAGAGAGAAAGAP